MARNTDINSSVALKQKTCLQFATPSSDINANVNLQVGDQIN